MNLGRANKYGAVKQMLDGVVFDSKLEAARYIELRLLDKAGDISQLRIHTRWPLMVSGKKVCAYESDFDYRDTNGKFVVEDVKGFLTAVYRLKKKMFEAQYLTKITEIGVKPKRRAA